MHNKLQKNEGKGKSREVCRNECFAALPDSYISDKDLKTWYSKVMRVWINLLLQ